MNVVYQKTKNLLLNVKKTNMENARNAHDLLLNKALHRLNNFEKKCLVWTGKYKNIEEVPNFVRQNVMERTRNIMRIRIANCMMAATAMGCVLMVYAGKQDAKKGLTLSKQNMEWHRQINSRNPEK